MAHRNVGHAAFFVLYLKKRPSGSGQMLPDEVREPKEPFLLEQMKEMGYERRLF